jgi:hypothetical protein
MAAGQNNNAVKLGNYAYKWLYSVNFLQPPKLVMPINWPGIGRFLPKHQCLPAQQGHLLCR